MTDLSSLFTTPLKSYHKSINILQTSSQKNLPKHTSKYSFDIPQIQTKLRNGMKKHIDAAFMKRQTQLYRREQRKALLVKILFIFAILLMLQQVLNLSAKIFFTYFMLAIANMLYMGRSCFSYQQDKITYYCLTFVRPIVFSALIYQQLKQATMSLEHPSIVWNCVFLSLAATSFHAFGLYSRSLFKSKIINILMKMRVAKKYYFKLNLIHKIIQAKWQHICSCWLQQTIFVILSFLLFLSVSLYLHIFSLQYFVPYNIVLLIIYTVIAELIIQIVLYVQFVIGPSSKMLSLTRDKFPLFISLLRIQEKQSHEMKNECIKCIYEHMQSNEGFLSTQTNQSILYNTYMDVCSQYLIQNLQVIHNKLSHLHQITIQNQKIVQSSKKIIDDLFIYPRKMLAILIQNHSIISVFNIISQKYPLIQTACLAQEQAIKVGESKKLPGRIYELVSGIVQKLSNVSNIGRVSNKNNYVPIVKNELCYLCEKLKVCLQRLKQRQFKIQ